MRLIREILVQLAVVCSFVCIVTKILDWYNPYMDFSGHVWIVQYCLYVAVITLALLPKRRHLNHPTTKHMRTYAPKDSVLHQV